MATFPSYNPQYSATKRSQSNLRITQFGDGYQQRTTFGLNQDPKVWNLTFNVDDEDADEIETFLEARADDCASFDWTPPGSSTAYKWICLSWTKRIPFLNRASLSMTFQQVFEP